LTDIKRLIQKNRTLPTLI